MLSKVGYTEEVANCQVYFHLNEFDEALTFALGAGKLFDLSAKTEYVETMIGRPRCVDLANRSTLRGSIYCNPNTHTR